MNRLYSLACAILLCVSAGPAFSKGGPERLTAVVEQKDLPVEIELSGVFKAEDKTEISVEPEEYSGSLIVTKVAPDGKEVKEGDVLLKFDKRDIQKAVAQAQVAVDEARLKLDKAGADFETQRIEQEAGIEKAKKELALARRKLEGSAAELAMKLEEKQKGVRSAENGLKDSQVNLEQLRLMYKKRELHASTENILLEREERDVAERGKSLEEARKKLEYAQAYEFPLERAKLEMEAVQKEIELKKSEIKATVELAEKKSQVDKAERDLKTAQEKVEALNRDLEKLTVKSPRSGIVFYGPMGDDNPFGTMIMRQTRGELRVGGRVTTHQILMTVASMERLSVQMKVLENDVQHAKPDLPIVIRPDAFPDLAIQGKVKEVGQVATRGDFFSEVREFTVSGTYEGSHPQIRAGMNCRVTLQADRIAQAVQVPVLAVFEAEGKQFCYVSESDKPVKREVKTGVTNGKAVQILEGLKKGERVYLYDPFRE